MLRDDIRPLLPQISAPTLVVWGERDSLIPVAHARDFQGVIPGARLSVISGAAHNPMVDAPEAFNEAVLAFLREEAAP
jgi:pimeloyl-ACP methyl ester carboxylesterase